MTQLIEKSTDYIHSISRKILVLYKETHQMSTFTIRYVCGKLPSMCWGVNVDNLCLCMRKGRGQNDTFNSLKILCKPYISIQVEQSFQSHRTKRQYTWLENHNNKTTHSGKIHTLFTARSKWLAINNFFFECIARAKLFASVPKWRRSVANAGKKSQKQQNIL